MALQLVREVTAFSVGVSSALAGETPVLAGLGVTKGLALEVAAVVLGGALQELWRNPHAMHAGPGLLNGGIALLGRRFGHPLG